MRWRYTLLGLALVGAGSAAFVATLPPFSPPGPTLAVDCDGVVTDVQSHCVVAPGAAVDVQIHVLVSSDTRYSGFQLRLRWNDARLDYLPTADPADEVVWPDCAHAKRQDNSSLDPPEPSLVFSCLPAEPPVEVPTFAGAVLTLHFECQSNGIAALSFVHDGDPDPFLVDSAGTHIDTKAAVGVIYCGYPNLGGPTVTPSSTAQPGPSWFASRDPNNPYPPPGDPVAVGAIVSVSIGVYSPVAYSAVFAEAGVPAGLEPVARHWVWPDCDWSPPHLVDELTRGVCYVDAADGASGYRGTLFTLDLRCAEPGFYDVRPPQPFAGLDSPVWPKGAVLNAFYQHWIYSRGAPGPVARVACVAPTATALATDVPPPTVPPTETPTPTATDMPDADRDGDGCTNAQEQGHDPLLGGGRDPQSFWDFFDTPDSANVRDHVVAVGDISRVVAHFGTSGDPGIDPLSAPLPAGYHTAFDRSPPPSGADLWDAGSPDGVIGIGDIGLAVAQFGHSCT